jgi:site-specific recombinase XerD
LLPAEPKRAAPDPRTSLTTRDIIRPDETLKQSIEAFLLDQRSEHTRRAYGKDLQRFVKFLLVRGFNQSATQTVEKLDRSVIIAYKDSLLTEGLEHTTIDRHLATLRSFFRWLLDDGLITKNPAEGVPFMNPKRISRTIGFTDEEVRKMLMLPDLHTRTGSQHYAILMILFHCGLRRSELCGLRTSNIGVERAHFVLRLRGKGNAERVVVMVPPVWNALKHYFIIARKDPAVDQYLFTPIKNNRTGVTTKPLDPSMIFYIVRRYAKIAGVANRVSPHSCRATAISNARDHNVPDRAIQEFAGWASPDMITRYDKRKTSVEGSAAHAIEYGNEDRRIPVTPQLDDEVGN